MSGENQEKRNDWLSEKIPSDKDGSAEKYEYADRAHEVFAHWSSGFTDDEVASFFGISPADVARDTQYILSHMTPRAILAVRNDRTRLITQRDGQDNYLKLLVKILGKEPDAFLSAGLLPTSLLKEFREAVGMTERPGAISINLNQKVNSHHLSVISGHGNTQGGPNHPINTKGIRSAEDIIRAMIAEDPLCGLQPVKDIDAHEVAPDEFEDSPDIDDVPDS